MKKSKKAILIYILLMILYIIAAYIFISYNKNIKIAINTDKYIPYECREEDIIEYHDCVLNEKNEIEILGDDPYLVVELQTMEVGSVSLEMLKDYQGEYKVYYALSEGFSEDKVATKSKNQGNVFIIGKHISLIRVDFEQSSSGSKYDFINNMGINLNNNIKQFSYGILKTLYIFMVYVFLSGIYMFYLSRKKRIIDMGITCIYNIIISYIWTSCISAQVDMFLNVTVFLVVCMGMFFWGNNTVLEGKNG